MDLSLRLRICSSDDKNYGNLLFKLVRVEEKVRYGKKALEVDKITSVLTESETCPILSYSCDSCDSIQSTMKRLPISLGLV